MSPDVGTVDWGHDEAEVSLHIHQLLQQVTGNPLIFHEAEQPDPPLMLQYAWFLADHFSYSFSDTSEERDYFLEQMIVYLFLADCSAPEGSMLNLSYAAKINETIKRCLMAPQWLMAFPSCLSEHRQTQ